MLRVDINTFKIGDSASCELEVTEALVDAFARLSGDDNPLHMDDAAARGYGFPGRVAHGMIALSAISRLIGTQLPGPGGLWLSQDVQFAAPVFIGDKLQARVEVQNISTGAQVIVLKTDVVKSETQEVVLRGTAKVRIPSIIEFNERNS